MVTVGDIYKFSILEIPEDWEATQKITIIMNGEEIEVFLSFGSNYDCNGAIYAYGDNSYEAFTDIESVAIYIREFSITREKLNDNLNILLSKYIVVFIKTTTEVVPSKEGTLSESLDLYIGERKV